MPFGIFLRRILADAGNTASAVVASAKEDPYKEAVKKSCGWPTQAEIELDKATTIAKLPSWAKQPVTQGEAPTKCYNAGIFGRDFRKFPACDISCQFSRRESCKALYDKMLAKKQELETAAMDTTKCFHGKTFGLSYSSHNFSSCQKGCPNLRMLACKKEYDTKLAAARAKAKTELSGKKEPSCPRGQKFGADFKSRYFPTSNVCAGCPVGIDCNSAHQKLVDSSGVAKCEQGLTFGSSFNGNSGSVCRSKCPSYIYEACRTASKIPSTSECAHGRAFGKDWTAAPGSTCYTKCHWKCSEACRDAKMKVKKAESADEKKGAKYIKLSSTREAGQVIFFVEEQSHHVDAFGKTTRYVIASDGYKLASAGVPGHYEAGVVYLQGGSEENRKRKLTVSVTEFARIEKAVAEYNEYFKDSANPDKPLPYPPPAAEKKAEPVTVAEGWVPKVGDKVVGLPAATEKYSTTREGWKGRVEEVSDDFLKIKVAGFYKLDTACFKKVI